ncbi:CLUMA_CG006299, isoform A [Clunio marinus]|uniref:CLUMA_CG006299, isoform A n=1 Tax=Clunio marinus TaxID=568069 RepID=A0A1J1HY76_9DIPT|nr:CLUMA_CG006299, isoform A [Clunio marinus]
MINAKIHRLGIGIVLLAILCSVSATRMNTKSGRSLMTWLRSMRTKRNGESTSDRVYTLADAIPGEPDRDYPILSEIPDTAFSCDGRPGGYYADIEARCQVFRVCANTANDTAKGFAFLCPNGTLFNQEFFVCDWYKNVNCQNSENFYKLNELIGDTMASLPKSELMTSAREIIMFPQQTPSFTGGNDIYSEYPRELGTQLGINGNSPSRGTSNLGQPISGSINLPTSPSFATSPGSGSGTQNGPRNGGDLNGGPQRGTNGGTVYVNSLGQLSTDSDSGFDPKKSFILKPDRDSTYDQDNRIPSNSFETLKGIGNSYSFGFPGHNAPTRGSEDLSEPVDPSAFGSDDKYLPPYTNEQNKQLYTYPHNRQPQNVNGFQGVQPQHTGEINTQLAEKSPKYEAPHVYGPTAQTQSAPKTNNYKSSDYPSPSQQPSAQPQSYPQQSTYTSPSRFQQPAAAAAAAAPTQQSYAQPSTPFQQSPSSASQSRYQQLNAEQRPQQGSQQNNNGQHYNHHQQKNNYHPNRSYQQPQQPQPFRPQNFGQNQNAERRISNGNQYQQNQPQNRNGQFNNGRGQSNEAFLRGLLQDNTPIHANKGKLVELIERLFIPPNQNDRVVSADVIHSPARESYTFTYPDSYGSASNSRNAYQSSNSRYHQHGSQCGHRGY